MAGITDPFKPAAGGITDPFRPAARPRPMTDAAEPQVAKRPERSVGQAIGDTSLGAARGAVNLASGVAALEDIASPRSIASRLAPSVSTGAENLRSVGLGGVADALEPVVRDLPSAQQLLGSAGTWLDSKQSEALQQSKQELADTEGFLGSAKKVVTDPRLLGNFIAEQIPNLALMGVGTAATGARAAGAAGARELERGLAAGLSPAAARNVARKAAESASRRAATRFATGANTGLETGAAGNQAYMDALQQPDEVWQANPEYSRRIAAGESAQEVKQDLARSAATRAAAIAAPISAVASRVAAPFEADVFTGRLARRPTAIAGGLAREATEEGVQEGGSQLATNLGVRVVDPTRGALEGVPEAAGTGAALGGVLGGGLAAGGALASRPNAQRQPEPEPAPAAEQRPMLALPPPEAFTVDSAGNAERGSQRPEVFAEADMRFPQGRGMSAPFAPGTARRPQPTVAPAGDITRAADPAARVVTAPPPRFAEAAPGSIADAANMLPSNSATAPVAPGGEAAPAAATSPEQAAAPRTSNPAAPDMARRLSPLPWINGETGEIREPTTDEVKLAIHERMNLQVANGVGINRPTISKSLGLTKPQFDAAWREVKKEREQGLTAPAPAVDKPAAAPTPVDLEQRVRDQIQANRQTIRGTDEATPAAQPAAPTEAAEQLGGGDTDAVPVAGPAPALEAVPAAQESTQDDAGSAGSASEGVETAPAEAAPSGTAAPSYDASPDVLDSDITPPSGGPFSQRAAADVQARRVEGGRVFEVDGGFVVRTPKAVAMDEGANSLDAGPSQVDGEADSVAVSEPASGEAPAAETAPTDRQALAATTPQPAPVQPVRSVAPAADQAPAAPEGTAAPPPQSELGTPSAGKGASGPSAQATPAPRGPQPKVRVRGGKPFYDTLHRDTVRAYYTPGREVDSYGGGRDRVLQYRDDDGNGRWSVQVQAIDKEGNPAIESGRPAPPRWHSTAPMDRELRAVFGPAVKNPRKGATPAARKSGAEQPKNAADAPIPVAAAPENAPKAANDATPAAPATLKDAAHQAATSPKNDLPVPTDAQKEAGNYRKGHIRLNGHDISIENPAGSKRNPEWPALKNHYGYFKGTIGKDKDHVDVFMTDRADDASLPVFVVDQVNKDGSFDEHKVIMGAATEEEARATYLGNYSKGWTGLGGIKGFTQDEFKAWIRDAEKTKRRVTRAPRAEPKAAAAAAPERIEDFGETLHGARKHYAAAYADRMTEARSLDLATNPLSQTWPEPDYQKLLEGGTDPRVVAFIHAARDEVPTKPQSTWKVRGWVEKVTLLRTVSDELLAGKIGVDAMLDGFSKTSAGLQDHLGGRMRLYQEVGHGQSLKGISLRKGHFNVYNGVVYKPPRTIWVVEKKAKSTAYSNWPSILSEGDSADEAIAAFKKKLAALDRSTDEKGPTRFEIYSRRSAGAGGAKPIPRVFIGKKIGRDMVDLKQFEDVQAARDFLANNREQLERLLDAKKEIPAHRRESNSPRVGTDHRSGADVTPEQFGEAFGFRGVQFGNYVEDGRRQQDLNEAYDALMDMAGVLGIPPRALSLNGTLGLAFGARGKGGANAASAHFEPGTIVINLTKRKGAGSLGHEWWHGLDNYFSRMRGNATSYVTAGARQVAAHPGGIRPEVARAFAELMDVIRGTGLRARSQQLDQLRSKDYWSTDLEMSARSFESYLIAKLGDEGMANDYLANIVSEQAYRVPESYPYLVADEVPAVRAAFDKLFQTIEAEPEADGKVRLFSRRGWSNSFPEVVTAGLLGTASGHADYAAAKAGDNAAAARLARDVVTPQFVADVRAALPAGSEPIIVPVVAREDSGNNKIPRAAAEVLAARLGAQVDDQIVQADKVGRGKADAIYRLANQPGFAGEVQAGQDYVLIDDTLTQGGTLAQLKTYIEDAGGRVVLATALTGKAYSRKLALSPETLARVRERFGSIENWWRGQFGYGFEGLTDSEARTVLSLDKGRLSPDGLRDRVAAAGVRGARPLDEGAAGRGSDAGAAGSAGRLIDPTSTPAFREWFGDSKVVDASGKPLVVYHGTPAQFEAFDLEFADLGDWGQGFYFTDTRAAAEGYAGGEGGRVLELYLSIQNPATNEVMQREEIQNALDDGMGFVEVTDLLQEMGYDGVEITHRGGEKEYVVFRAEQIKSATGNVTFNPTDPRILFSLGDRPQGLPFDRALQLKAELTKDWGDAAPAVVVVRDAEGFPDSAKADADYRRAEGFYDGRPTVWLNASMITSERRFAEVLAHEAIGHYGIERIVGEREWGGIVYAIGKLATTGKASDAMLDVLADVRRRYGDLDPSTYASEVLAVMAERGIRNSLINRVIAAVRRFLRRIMPSTSGWSENDVRALLAQAESFLRAGRNVEQRQRAVQAYAFSKDITVNAHGERSITLEGEKFVERSGRYYLVNGTGHPKDFDSYEDAWQAAQRTGAEVMRDEPIDGEPQTYSVVVPDGDVRAATASRRFFSKPAAEVLDDIDAVQRGVHAEGVLERARQLLADAVPKKLKDATRPTWLGALTTRHLAELGTDYFADIKNYSDDLTRMQADRNTLQAEAEAIAERARAWASKNRSAARQLFDLMHESTIDGVDPSEAYRPLQFRWAEKLHDATEKNIREAILGIKQQMRERAGDSKKDMLERIKALNAMRKAEKRRAATYGGMVGKWNELPAEAQQLYREFRDAYRQRSDAVEEALVKRVQDLKGDGVSDGQIKKMALMVRQQFEDNRLQGVYFPLQRFGRFFVSATKGDDSTFLMFESGNDLERAVKDLRARGWTIGAQGLKGEAKAKDAPPGSFVADVIGQLHKNGVSEKTQDEVYQIYLQALPELSMRKHQIHRKAIPGFDTDAVRAFAYNMHHGSHQLARLRYSHLLQLTLDKLRKDQDAARREEGADTRKILAGDAIIDELARRHEWIMNPQDSQLTNLVSSLGFTYYLAATPAAALVNLTQTALVTYPYLASRYGAIKAMNYLLAASRDAARTLGNIQKTLTTDEERAAHAALMASGALDKTQAHNLAGIAEGGLAGYNPAWAKAMEIIGWGFHKTEVVNREASAMAAFRLARADGASFNDAVKAAHEAVFDTHFDYSNANRARFMQSGTAKVLLMFRQYSLNMTWTLGRMVWQATKAEKPEVRAIARRNLAGVLGMSALFSGVLGLPTMGVVMGTLNALQSTFGDDDEPWDAETEFRAFLADMLGPTSGALVSRGAANAITGADIAGRVGLSDLWVRDADRELEGRGLYYHLLEQAAGPMGGVLKNVLVGKSLIDEGHTWRGVETMLPKGLKDVMKAGRYATQGVNTLRGDPLVDDAGLWATLLQANGFTPAEVSEQYERNRALKNYEQHIVDRRQHLMNGFALALRTGDAGSRQAVLQRIQNFNRANPELAITSASISRSIASRARYSAKAEAGIVINPKLAARLNAAVGE